MSKRDTIDRLIKEGKIDEALKIASLQDTQSLFEIGLSFLRVERKDETKAAEKIFNRVTQLDPRHADAWLNSGRILSGRGKHKDAVKCFEKATEINPKNDEAWYSMGAAFANSGKHEEAIRSYDKAIEINPNHMEVAYIWYYRGKSLQSLKRYEEASKSFGKAIETCRARVGLYYRTVNFVISLK